MLGDAENDSDVDIKDVTTIQLFCAKFKLLSENAQKCSDVDGNLKVNIKDATYIQMRLAEIISKYPVER